MQMLVLHRYTEICGFQGVVAGLLVGLKQIMPENDVTLLGYVKFRAKVLTNSTHSHANKLYRKPLLIGS